MGSQATNAFSDDRGAITPNLMSFGASAIDAVFGGGIVRGGVHEIYAPSTAHIGAATGFAAALAARAAGLSPILWVRQDFLDTETGALSASGLAEIGVNPERFILVRARDAEGVLRAGEQAARCAALGAVVIEPWGEPKILDFKVSRRLSLASAKSGVPVLMLRASAAPAQSAASTRWKVAACASRALEANAPGHPAFTLNLLRQRGGADGQTWHVEWNRDRKCFEQASRVHVAPVPRAVVSLSCNRTSETAAEITRLQRTG